MKKINIAELLKNCPKGMELDCTLYENVIFDSVDMDKIFPIKLDISGAHDIYLRLTEEGCLTKHQSAKCTIFPKGKTTWEGFMPPDKFKDGDIAYTRSNDGNDYIFIFKNITNNTHVNSYLHLKGDELRIINVWLTNCDDKYLRIATEEEKQKLFQAIKDNGYRWDEETKTLVKLIEKPKFKVGDKIIHKDDPNVIYTITDIVDDCYYCGANLCFSFDYQDDYKLVYNKFDISTLKPYDKVLARDNDSQKWDAELFSFYDNESEDYHFRIVGTLCARYCIPFMGNEHLLGTTDDCNEFYKTWE